jgi:SAM-dependent methyltransferase
VPLAYYSQAATREFWSEHWADENVDRLVRVASTSPLTAVIAAALPSDGPILEAGCGLGPYVILLRQRGHRVAGADWSLDALRRCRQAAPSAPVAVMDLARLAVRAGTLAAYVSLGVVEHDERGPDAIVAEAARALRPGGVVVLSVPYWNGVRRLLAPRIARQGRRVHAAGGEFYQFAFARREVRAFLEARGLRVLSFHPYDPARMWRKCFRRIAAGLGESDGAAADGAGPRRQGRRRLARALVRRLLYHPVSLRLFGHMILAVAIKPRP